MAGCLEGEKIKSKEITKKERSEEGNDTKPASSLSYISSNSASGRREDLLLSTSSYRM